MPHLAPVPLSEVQDEDIRQRFEHYRNTRGFTPNSIMTMVRRPQIVRAFMALNQAAQALGLPAVADSHHISVSDALAHWVQAWSRIYNVAP